MATKSSAAPASGLAREIARIHVRLQRALLACHQIGSTQCIILTELGRGDPLTLRELAARLKLDKSWTSRAVDQLAKEGLVRKVAGKADRRTVALSVTRAGAAYHERIEQLLDEQVERVLARVPAKERAAVGAALRLLHEAYSAEMAAEEAESEAVA